MRLYERLIKSQGSHSIQEHLLDVKAVVDECALFGTKIDNDEFTLYIINGLSSDFKDIFAVVRTQDTSISFGELFEKPTEHASYLWHTENCPDDNPVIAFVANCTVG